MKDLLIGLIILIIGAISTLAYYQPKSYEKIRFIVELLGTIIFIFLLARSIGIDEITMKFNSANLITSNQEARIIIENTRYPVPFIMIGHLIFACWCLFLRYIHQLKD